MNFEELTHLAMEAGFTHAVPLDVHTIDLKAEVRDMCASGGCGKYGACWSCPPACGTLDECRARVLQYTKGIIVQTVGELEDPLDGEGMMETEAVHKKNFDRMYALLREQHADVLALGAGGCKKCAVCTYPDAPCRRPNEMVSSMEAYGMLVTEVCQRNHLKYYYGQNTIAYLGCFLFGREDETHGCAEHL